MALKPLNEKHKAQILAGTLGRTSGHLFEKNLTIEINSIDWSSISLLDLPDNVYVFRGKPAKLLISYISNKKKVGKLTRVKAWWLGGLATTKEGDVILNEKGIIVGKSKSDILLEIEHSGVEKIGVSIKTCNKSSPTNDQLYFTTASAFCALLRANDIPVSIEAEHAMKMFCGDAGFRPLDNKDPLTNRKSDPNRWFFEELPAKAKEELILLFSNYQNEITRILLQRAYANDPYVPLFLLHQTKLYQDHENCEIALFTMDELIELSARYNGFWTKPYIIRKGTYKGDLAVHEAPRFGFIQFQRGGQKQHPTQLQFNLEAGYFYKLPAPVKNV